MSFARSNLCPAQTNQFTTDFANFSTVQAQAQAATATKDASRALAETKIRSFAGLIQADPSISDASRESLGLPVHSTSRAPTPPVTNRPLLQVDTSQRLQHTIRVSDESTPNSRARPENASGFELYCKTDNPAPTGLGECEILGYITRSPDAEIFDPADGGKIVHYMARWVSKRGAKGPISETVSATVPA